MEPELADRLSRFKVPSSREYESGILPQIVSWIAPAAIFFRIWFFLFRRLAEKQGMGGLMSIGKSRTKAMMEKSAGLRAWRAR